jgi:hypothetical protein
VEVIEVVHQVVLAAGRAGGDRKGEIAHGVPVGRFGHVRGGQPEFRGLRVSGKGHDRSRDPADERVHDRSQERAPVAP